MPLTTRVSFETVLEKGKNCRIQSRVNGSLKWSKPGLKCRSTPNVFGESLCFYAKMDKQGQILIPKLTLALMANKENPNLEGYIFDVWLEPA
jgi:hypothetical protein